MNSSLTLIQCYKHYTWYTIFCDFHNWTPYYFQYFSAVAVAWYANNCWKVKVQSKLKNDSKTKKTEKCDQDHDSDAWVDFKQPSEPSSCMESLGQHQEATATSNEGWLTYLNQDHLTAAKQSPLSGAEERARQSGNTQTVRHSGRGLCGLWLRQLSFTFLLSGYCCVKKRVYIRKTFITVVAVQRPHLACRRSPLEAGELCPQIP